MALVEFTILDRNKEKRKEREREKNTLWLSVKKGREQRASLEESRGRPEASRRETSFLVQVFEKLVNHKTVSNFRTIISVYGPIIVA